MRQATSDGIREIKEGTGWSNFRSVKDSAVQTENNPLYSSYRDCPKILHEGYNGSAFMLMVTFADPIRKHDNTFLIDIFDKASASTAVRTGYLKFRNCISEDENDTHSYPFGFLSFASCTFALCGICSTDSLESSATAKCRLFFLIDLVA